MDVKEKLVELLEELCVDYGATAIFFTSGEAEVLAGHLIAHGVTVQEDCKSCAEATQTCVVKLQEQIAELRSAQEWIPASEHPKDTCEYWIAYKAGGDYFYSTGYYDGKHWYSSITHNKIPVTHWMPLPEPPRCGSADQFLAL